MSQLLHAPGFAALDGGRAVETRLIGGRWQAVAWEPATDRRRVLTDRPHGVDLSEIEPDGGHVWWFDADTGGAGHWRRQPFTAGPAAEALTGLPQGRAYGLAFDRTGASAAVALGVGDTTLLYTGAPGGPARPLGTAPDYLGLADLSPDGSLLALAGRPGGPDAVVLRPADPAAEALALPGGPGLRLWPIEFHPEADHEPELLLVTARGEHYGVATWRPGRGLRHHPGLGFGSEITVGWYGGGRGVLVQHEHAGRSRLLRAQLDGPPPEPVPLPDGTVHDLSCAPDGTLHCLWSREAVPPRTLALRPDAPPADPAPHRPGGARRTERWTDRPYGRIHSFLATPDGPGPWPTLFLVHGGPGTHDRDSYDPTVDTLVRAGHAVVRTNYRGSTGYGARWQHDWGHRVGLAQAEDLAAVRAELVAEGVAEAGRTGLCGISWGGYLTLLALGLHPGLWSLGMAVHPIADYPAAHRATTAALRATDRELFGGSPEQVPGRYRRASPLTYVERVRAPVLLVASRTDERCPAEQVVRYADALGRVGAPHELVWVDGGHRSRRAGDHASVLAAQLRFTRRVWRP